MDAASLLFYGGNLIIHQTIAVFRECHQTNRPSKNAINQTIVVDPKMPLPLVDH